MSNNVIDTVLTHFFTNGAPPIITDCNSIKHVFEEIRRLVTTVPSNILMHLTYMMSLMARDSFLDEFRMVNLRVQDIFTVEEVIIYWTFMDRFSENILQYNVRDWCMSSSDTVCMAIIVRTARKCIRYLTVNYMRHKNAVADHTVYQRINGKYYDILTGFDKIVHELMSLFPTLQLAGDSRVLDCFDTFQSIAICCNSADTREVKLNELLASPTCKQLRALLDGMPSKGELLINAPDLNACSLCNHIFLCMGVAELPFVILSGCNHLICITCIRKFYNRPADAICVINDCNKWNPFWITEKTFEEYKARTAPKTKRVSSCIIIKMETHSF